MIIVIVILSLFVLVGFGLTINFYSRNKNTKEQMEKFDRLLTSAEQDIREYRDGLDEEKKKNNELNKKVAELNDVINDKREQVHKLELAAKQTVINGVAEADENKLEELNKFYNEKVAAFEALNGSYEARKAALLELEKDIDKKVGRNEELGKEKIKLDNELRHLEGLLDAAKSTHRASLGLDKNEISRLRTDFGASMSLKERRILELLEGLIEVCPELEKDLNGLKWKKVWLSKVQGVCKKEGLDGVCGIYRIVLKEDEDVCYIGQAVNVKERWYQHVKKMLGVDSKGDERLYWYDDPGVFW